MTHFGNNTRPRTTRLHNPEDEIVTDARKLGFTNFIFGACVGLVLGLAVMGAIILWLPIKH